MAASGVQKWAELETSRMAASGVQKWAELDFSMEREAKGE